MKSLRCLRAAGLLGCAIALAACAAGSDRLWVPQGPGNAEGEAAPARPATAGPSPQKSAEPQRKVSAPEPRAASVEPSLAYTQASRYGDLLFLSGQIAGNAETGGSVGGSIAEQTDEVMQKISTILRSHGLTMANVIQSTVYLSNINDLPVMNTAYEEHFRGTLPARTVVATAALPRGALVQIAVVAGR